MCVLSTDSNTVLHQLNPTKCKVMETAGVWQVVITPGSIRCYGVTGVLQEEKTAQYTEGAAWDSKCPSASCIE